MKILFFDTETTGLVVDWNKPSSEKNPRLVQLGMQLCNEQGRALKTFGHIIKPVGFTIPQEVADKSHGISTEMANEFGCPLEFALGAFEAFLTQADLVVAHNIKYDLCVMLGELDRKMCMSAYIELQKRAHFCTMLESTNVCKIKKKAGDGYKWPRLSEAYDFFFQEELKNAHDALTDVVACKRIYFEVFNKVGGKGELPGMGH